MKSKWSLKRDNRGASLIAVLTAIVVVSLLGVVIGQITVANVHMKLVELKTKENFYKTEVIVDDLKTGMNNKAAKAMQDAYMEMIANYRSVTASGASAQGEFARKYLDKMIEIYGSTEYIDHGRMQRMDSVEADAKVAYEVGYYSISALKNSFVESAYGATNDFLITKAVDAATPDSAAYYRADYEAGTFVIQNVEIKSKTDDGYNTTIKTDIVFSAPTLDLQGSGLVREFMRYSLIADNSINANTSGIVANGNVYAGAGGIFTENASAGATFGGSRIVTRGDIKVDSNAELKFGTGNSEIWVENIITDSSNAKITIDGTAYVADDLEMNGRNGVVTLKGLYFGYNFQKNYGSLTGLGGAQYSSSIVINGKNSLLDVRGLDFLGVAGRTYVTRNAGSADVPLGQSIAVRSDQMAYYIPETFLDTTNPSHVVFASEDAVNAYLGVANVCAYVNPDHPVVAYHFTGLSGPDCIYYLDFGGSEENANAFFMEYFGNNTSQVTEYAGNYLNSDALKFDSNPVYNVRGDMYYRNGSDLQALKGTIGAMWNGAGSRFFAQYANYAVDYKSLQLDLQKNVGGAIGADDVRFGDSNDKTLDNLFDRLIRRDELRNDLASYADHTNVVIDEADAVTGERNVVVLVDNQGGTPYTVPTEYECGIILATGDVKVNGNFSGLIISGNTISFATNATVNANEALVSRLFAEDCSRSAQKFAQYFEGFNVITDSETGAVNVQRYVSYDNWTKTVE